MWVERKITSSVNRAYNKIHWLYMMTMLPRGLASLFGIQKHPLPPIQRLLNRELLGTEMEEYIIPW